MDSKDFETVLVKDDRIANLTDKITYAVNKGGQQITSASFEATSESNSSHTYNVIVPSLETIIDRRLIWQSTVTLRIVATTVADIQAIGYGIRDCLAPFPLHQLCTSMSATINNNTVSVNMNDVLNPIIRMLDPAELARCSNTTPVAYDTYMRYSDMAGTSNNAFGGFNIVNGVDVLHPRGSFALDAVARDAGFTLPLAPAAGNGKEAFVRFTVSEPLLLSPFLFGKTQSNNSGMYGIQNMSFNFNIGDASTVWRHYGTVTGAATDTSQITAVQLVSFQNSRLICQFLTPHPSDQLSSRCCVPFYELPRYITSNLPTANALPGQTFPGNRLVPAYVDYSSSTISLNQVPDKLIIFLRRKTRNWYNTDSFLAINKVNINWNNQTGMLSSFDAQSLWRMSVEAGSNQTFDEFRGYAYRPNAAGEDVAGNGAGTFVSTCGSILMLNMGEHLNLVEDYYAPGSIGSFSLQIKVSAANFDSANFEPELVIIAMNSGVFATERGTSSTYTALLTKQDVLDASMKEPVSRSEYKRMVGGGFLDSLKSAWRWLTSNSGNLGKVANTALNVYDITKGGPTSGSTKSREIVKALGGARSGGAMSGGLSSRLR